MESVSNEQNTKVIRLNEPDLKRGSGIMEALSNRKSVREFKNKPLSHQDLSDLLWAAKGINRPESGGLTSPNSIGKKEIDIYACTPEGACLYCAEDHCLIPVAEGDLRPAIACGQDYVLDAPVVLVIVADLSVFEGELSGMANLLGAIDGGIVCENIYLFCAGNGFDTIARGTMEQATLKSALKLKESQVLLLNHPVGYSGN